MPEPDRLRHFEALYSASDDPWDVRGAWYEQRKRALLLAGLARPRYRGAFEPGCGNGEMSAALALRCDRLLACDGAASALDAARRRLDGLANVRFEQRRLPHDWPRKESFDLIVVSELAYYFSLPDVGAMLSAAVACLEPGGELVLCHYQGDFDDRLCTTEAVHAAAHAMPGLRRLSRHQDEQFVLESWRKEGDRA